MDSNKNIRVENLMQGKNVDYIVHVDLEKEGRGNWKGDFKNINNHLKRKKKTVESKPLQKINQKEWDDAILMLKTESEEFGKLHMKDIDEVIEKASKNRQNVVPEVKERTFSSSPWSKACIFIAALFLLTVLKKIIWH